MVDRTSVPDHARDRYLPETERRGLALCLSGGGFRASLFHLGALRRFNELGILPHLTTITSVSGCSILSAHLAAYWSEIGDWESRIAAPFRAFTAKNLRTWPILKRLLPWNWLRQHRGARAGCRLRKAPDRAPAPTPDDLDSKRAYAGMKAYQQSKLANVLFTYELARRLGSSRVTVNCLHPGDVGSGFGRNNRGVFGPRTAMVGGSRATRIAPRDSVARRVGCRRARRCGATEEVSDR